MKSKTLMLATAVGSLIALRSALASAEDEPKTTERCYGVAKAGKNDCGAPGHACAGLAKKDRDPNEYINLPKGTCERLVGGIVKPEPPAKS
jgi:uncharacterized membrane protein